MRSTSRGYIQLRSNNPTEDPIITFNCMETDQDKNKKREGIRLTREILGQPAFQSSAGKESSTGKGVQKDEGIDEFVWKKLKALTFHLAAVEWEMTRNWWLTQK